MRFLREPQRQSPSELPRKHHVMTSVLASAIPVAHRLEKLCAQN